MQNITEHFKAITLKQRKIIMKIQILCLGGRMPSPWFRDRNKKVNDFKYVLHFNFMLGFRIVNVRPLTLIFFNRHPGHCYWMITVNRYFVAEAVFKTQFP